MGIITGASFYLDWSIHIRGICGQSDGRTSGYHTAREENIAELGGAGDHDASRSHWFRILYVIRMRTDGVRVVEFTCGG